MLLFTGPDMDIHTHKHKHTHTHFCIYSIFIFIFLFEIIITNIISFIISTIVAMDLSFLSLALAQNLKKKLVNFSNSPKD